MKALRTIQTQNEEEIYFSPILQKLYVYERKNIRVHPDGVDAKPQYEVRAVIAGMDSLLGVYSERKQAKEVLKEIIDSDCWDSAEIHQLPEDEGEDNK